MGRKSLNSLLFLERNCWRRHLPTNVNRFRAEIIVLFSQRILPKINRDVVYFYICNSNAQHFRIPFVSATASIPISPIWFESCIRHTSKNDDLYWNKMVHKPNSPHSLYKRIVERLPVAAAHSTAYCSSRLVICLAILSAFYSLLHSLDAQVCSTHYYSSCCLHEEKKYATFERTSVTNAKSQSKFNRFVFSDANLFEHKTREYSMWESMLMLMPVVVGALARHPFVQEQQRQI